jgi:hypothetical protein
VLVKSSEAAFNDWFDQISKNTPITAAANISIEMDGISLIPRWVPILYLCMLILTKKCYYR